MRDAAATLRWGLVIATYNREPILLECLRLAATQSRPPAEIIVVDSSTAWEATYGRVLAEIAPAHPAIRWRYLRADTPSLTVQRNQGIAAAAADILFLIDDDSLMFPDCAAEIMAVYERDVSGSIAGVQANLATQPPAGLTIDDRPKPVGHASSGDERGALGRLKQRLWRDLFLMDSGKLFIPYDEGSPKPARPAAVGDGQIEPARLFHGCRMTFRRSVFDAERFDPLLLSYCPGEDLDLSYRASRRGALVTALRARLFHFQSASGRVDRFKVSMLSALNQAVLIRRHSRAVEPNKRRYFALMRRRLIAEILKDGLSRRWSFPQVRGLLAARRHSPSIFAMSDDELSAWYPQFQRELLSGRRA